MDMFDSFSLIIGVVAVGIGLYELVTKTLLGRDCSVYKKEAIQKFLPYDIATYIVAGGLLGLMGAGKWFPWAKNTTFIIIGMIISLIAIVLNVVAANKILGKPPQKKNHDHL